MNPPGQINPLKKLFVEVGCFEKICEVLSTVKDEAKKVHPPTHTHTYTPHSTHSFSPTPTCSLQYPEEASVLACLVFSAFSAVMKGSDDKIKESFEQRIGHTQLTKLVSEMTPPTKSILQAGLDMAVDGTYTYEGDTHSIENSYAIGMLLRWMLYLNHDLSEWLSVRVLDMCSYGAYNKQLCCLGRLITVATEVLAKSQKREQPLQKSVEGE